MLTAAEILHVPVDALVHLSADRPRRPHGGHGPGQWHPAAKMTNAQAAEVRDRYATGKTSYRRLGAEYGVGDATIRDCVKWRTYPQAGGSQAFRGE